MKMYFFSKTRKLNSFVILSLAKDLKNPQLKIDSKHQNQPKNQKRKPLRGGYRTSP